MKVSRNPALRYARLAGKRWKGLTPRKAIFDALQRCPDGLTLNGLAVVAYGDDGELSQNAAYHTIWRLRDHARIEAVGGSPHGAGLFRLLGITV
jgi:hypothetical protein